MLGQYLPILALFVLGFIFAWASLLASKLLAPRRATPTKLSAYECGVSDGSTKNPMRFPVRFFLIAMMFIIFDIEVVFLYPFVMVFRELGAFGLIAVAIFSFAVFESFVYLIGSGALEWGSVKRVAPVTPVQATAATSENRSVKNTVRRVGDDGRELDLTAVSAHVNRETAGVMR